MKTELSLQAKIAAHASWAKTVDRPVRTAPARAGLQARFERLADPDGTLSPEARAKRAEHLKKVHFMKMAQRSIAVRRAKAAAKKTATRSATTAVTAQEKE
jgi:hypothetical protein